MEDKPVKIRKGVLTSTLSTRRVPVRKILDLCAYRPDGYQFSPAYRARRWDGYIRLAKISVGRIQFPSGLVPIIYDFLKDYGVNARIVRTYKIKQLTEKDIVRLKNIKLRKYQKEALSVALHHQRGVIKMGTGGGKTAIAAALIKTCKRRSLFLTHKKDILYQAADVLSAEIGSKYVGIIGDGVDQQKEVTVASIPTLWKNYAKYKSHLDTKTVLIADEVHHSVATTWYKIIQSINSPYRIGLTATPAEGAKSVLLTACIGPVIYSYSSQLLVNDGYLSKPEIYSVVIDKPKLRDRLDYIQAYSEGIINNEYRNEVVVDIVKSLPKSRLPVAIFVVRKKHLRNIRSLLKKTNLTMRALHGEKSGKIRAQSFKSVSEEKIDVLLVSTIFDEGIDLPNIRTLILAGGGKSPIKTVQRLGRGMRRYKKKKSILVFDFNDVTHPYLKKHSKSRFYTYSKEGFDAISIRPDKINKKRFLGKRRQLERG